jgi:uncharacterized membrane protein YhaH (DUF805 family)
MSLIRLLYDPRGRIGRMEFVAANLLTMTIFSTSLSLLMNFTHDLHGHYVVLFFLNYVLFYMSIVFIVIKRFRDLDLGGLNILWLFFPVVNIFYLYMLVFRSRKSHLNLLERLNKEGIKIGD